MDAPIAKLPVWRTIVDTYRLTWTTLSELFPYIWPWLVLWLAVDLATAWFEWPLDPESKLFAVSSLLHNLIIVAIGSAIAVPWHRRLLLGEVPARGAVYQIDRRSFRYAALAGTGGAIRTAEVYVST